MMEPPVVDDLRTSELYVKKVLHGAEIDTDCGYGPEAGWIAVVWLALDRETGTLDLYDCYKRQHGEPTLHAGAVKDRGAWIPGVGDAAGLVMTQHDAEQLVSPYRRPRTGHPTPR